MKIGIDINEVLRDYIGKLISVYEKYTETQASLPVDSFELEKHFTFDNGIDGFNDFAYRDAAFEIFGSANEINGNIVALNEFLLNIKKEGEHSLKIVSREAMQSIPATYFFLSKTSCKIDEVKFYTKYEKLWDDVDVLITANPRTINAKPEGKICLMVNTAYNKEIESDFKIKDLKEFLNDKELQNKVFKTKVTKFDEI